MQISRCVATDLKTRIKSLGFLQARLLPAATTKAYAASSELAGAFVLLTS